MLITQASDPEHGVSDFTRSILLIAFGISQLVGRIVCGILSDRGLHHPIMTSYSLYLLGNAGASLSILFFAIIGINLADFGFICFALLYGFSIAPLVCLRSVLMENLFGIARLHATYGWLLFFQGVFFLLAFPVTDWLNYYDATMSSLFTFSCLVLSAILMAFNYKPFFKERFRRISSIQSAEISLISSDSGCENC